MYRVSILFIVVLNSSRLCWTSATRQRTFSHQSRASPARLDRQWLSCRRGSQKPEWCTAVLLVCGCGCVRVCVCVYDCIVSYVCDVCVCVCVFESMVNVTNVSMQVLLNRATWDTWHGWASGAKEHSFLVFWTSLRLWKEGT